MKFALMVSEGPYTHQASDTAWNFANAALAKGHEVMRVFFYHDGVYNATRLTELQRYLCKRVIVLHSSLKSSHYKRLRQLL